MIKPLLHLLQTALNDKNELERLPVGCVEDASRLNLTRVANVYPISNFTGKIEEALRAYLQEARSRRLPISIAGASHTMGGHTFTENGLIVDMSGLCEMRLEAERDVLWMQAGARWSQVLAYLHLWGRSVKVMQSNNAFSVGGSLGANCHGWQPMSPPIASQVVAFRMLLADGRVVRCSREEEAELFALVIGGYGLFGIVLDVELAVVKNELYGATSSVMPSGEYAAFYTAMMKVEMRGATQGEEYAGMMKEEGSIGLAYGRLSVEPRRFLREMLFTKYTVLPHSVLPPLSKPGMGWIRRLVFRGSVGSEYGKELRWSAEKRLGQFVLRRGVTRNHVMNEGVEVFQNRSRWSTDILQEYFVPVERLEVFLEEVRRIVPAYQADLLNVTVRYVAPDRDSFLRYADQAMFALVMLFNCGRTRQADEWMERMTRDLIEAVLTIGGRYYLPYRLHGSVEQFQRAYPQAGDFFRLKRKYDPDEIFQNEFYRKYGVSGM